mgnify:CR=1 FL=1
MLLSTIQEMNEQMDATILMVTHDAFSASYANRILFLRDGEIYKEIMKGSSSRKEFFEQILEVLNTLGGGVNDVRLISFTECETVCKGLFNLCYYSDFIGRAFLWVHVYCKPLL